MCKLLDNKILNSAFFDDFSKDTPSGHFYARERKRLTRITFSPYIEQKKREKIKTPISKFGNVYPH